MADQPKNRILVVDDEADVVAFLTALFEDNGYAVLSAATGVEAIDKFLAERPDLVTLDMTMPEQSGVKTYRQMKGDPQQGKTPVVIVTGVSDELEKFIKGRKQVPQPDGYMSKPIDGTKLVAMVRALLGG
jgi:DNA-binding response OmpR family regulator